MLKWQICFKQDSVDEWYHLLWTEPAINIKDVDEQRNKVQGHRKIKNRAYFIIAFLRVLRTLYELNVDFF